MINDFMADTSYWPRHTAGPRPARAASMPHPDAASDAASSARPSDGPEGPGGINAAPADTEIADTGIADTGESGAATVAVPSELPMIVSDELADLGARFGAPRLWRFDVAADEYIYSFRWRTEVDRRAEVVFAVQADGPAGHPPSIWVHAKSHYPAHILRLPSGGVHPTELVEEALFREIDEEMGLAVEILGFLGMIEYHFWYRGSMRSFASYVFLLRSMGGRPVCRADEDISEFRAVRPDEILQLAYSLRSLIGRRRGWGQWRALAHDLVYESLAGSAMPNAEHLTR